MTSIRTFTNPKKGRKRGVPGSEQREQIQRERAYAMQRVTVRERARHNAQEKEEERVPERQSK